VAGHDDVERRSLAYHEEVARRLDAALVAQARARVERWLAAVRPVAPAHARAWLELLDRPLPELTAALTADDEGMGDLRHSTPFAGVLAPAERWAILRADR